MKSQTKIQISGIMEDMRIKIRAMYIAAVQRIGTTTCAGFDALMREIHTLEIKLHQLGE